MTPQRIIVLPGAHKTATSHLQSALASASPALAAERVAYIGPQAIRRHLMPLTYLLRDGAKPSILRDVVAGQLDLLTDGTQPDTVILADENILGSTDLSMLVSSDQGLYPWGAGRLSRLIALLPDTRIEVGLAIRDLAGFLPSAYGEELRHAPIRTWADYRAKVPVEKLSWSAFVRRLGEEIDPVPIALWRYDGYPAIAKDLLDWLLPASAADAVSLSGPVKRSGFSGGAIARIEAYLASGGDPRDKSVLHEARTDFPQSPEFPVFAPWTSEEKAGLLARFEAEWAEILSLPRVNTLQGDRAPLAGEDRRT